MLEQALGSPNPTGAPLDYPLHCGKLSLASLTPNFHLYLLIRKCFPMIPNLALICTSFLQKGAASAIPSQGNGQGLDHQMAIVKAK